MYQNRLLLLGVGVILFGVFFIVIGKNKAVVPHLTGVKIAGQIYHLEVADTDAQRRKGLGDRDSLCDDCGMLFEFEAPGRYPFWMKDMRFSIDILWLSGQKVVSIERVVSPDLLGILTPDVAADKVLELNAHSADVLSVGDEVSFLFDK